MPPFFFTELLISILPLSLSSLTGPKGLSLFFLTFKNSLTNFIIDCSTPEPVFAEVLEKKAFFSLANSLTRASSTFSSSTKSALFPKIPITKKK